MKKVMWKKIQNFVDNEESEAGYAVARVGL